MRALAVIFLLATPVAAQETSGQFRLPEGCTAYLTVQLESCKVEHHFHCEGDPVGHKRDVRLTQTGQEGASLIDDEAQWISSVDGADGSQSWLEDNPADPHSISTLFAEGMDTFEFRTLSESRDARHYLGQDELTGRQVEIDGVILEEVIARARITEGEGSFLYTSREYVSREWRLFFSGLSQYQTPEGTFKFANRPVEFIFHDEPGFLSNRPKHGCGDAIS